jgi:hypothetical protein
MVHAKYVIYSENTWEQEKLNLIVNTGEMNCSNGYGLHYKALSGCLYAWAHHRRRGLSHYSRTAVI